MRPSWTCRKDDAHRFQFTHPGRGATILISFVPHTFCVSIHAPREGCDEQDEQHRGNDILFQFTHPGRGATGNVNLRRPTSKVSIHAPREGCDTSTDLSSSRINGFNSRTPGGVRPDDITHRITKFRFQFTHPGRGATVKTLLMALSQRKFQFTHPGRGATAKLSGWSLHQSCFNSRTPGGVRL